MFIDMFWFRLLNYEIFNALFPQPLFFLGVTDSLKITPTDQPMIEKAQGEKVTLPCMFTLSQEDEGPLDIEWVLIPIDNQKNEQTVSRQSFSNAI